MLRTLLQSLPYQINGIPGIGGRIKDQPGDFEVEEIPAYEPSGQGEFLYLWIEKCDLGAEFFQRQIARRLNIRSEDIGTAGLKDRRAVTRQWVSVPATVEPLLAQLDGDGLQVLQVSKHNNKLKPGHLKGNRFRIRVRGVESEAALHLPKLLEQLRQQGLANFYGEQRFGREGETLQLGLELLLGTASPSTQRGRGPNKFLQKLALSAVQSALFNRYLATRMNDGLLSTVLAGDVMHHWPQGGIFHVADVATEQARFDSHAIVPTGPMFGRKMFPAQATAAERETAVLQETGLSLTSFHGFGKLLQGTRRFNLVWVDDLQGSVEEGTALLTFTLPAGSYATVLLREVMKTSIESAEVS